MVTKKQKEKKKMILASANKVLLLENVFIFNIDHYNNFLLEYAMLDKQLDDLNSVLDLLESKNDRIQAQLKALLENSREIRQSLAEENTSTENKTSESSPQN